MSDFHVATIIGVVIAVLVKIIFEDLRRFAPYKLLPALMIGPGLGLLMKTGYNYFIPNLVGLVLILVGFALLLWPSKKKA